MEKKEERKRKNRGEFSQKHIFFIGKLKIHNNNKN